MKRILIPTDFSENATNAIRYALELFKYEETEFFIMHAYQDEIYVDDNLLTQQTLDELTKIISDRTHEHLKKTLKQIKEISQNSKHTFRIVSANSMLLDEADKVIDEENIDIVVMGTQGKTNDRKLTFGSHTLQVLKYVQCPVLAIPKDYIFKQPKHILFPNDYMIPYKQRELKLLSEIALPYKSTIDMLYISTSNKLSLRQEHNQNFIKNKLGENKVNFKTKKSKNITKAIRKYIKEHNTDMLVMVNTRHSFLESILFQSTIDKMSLYMDIPFLALQNMRRY